MGETVILEISIKSTFQRRASLIQLSILDLGILCRRVGSGSDVPDNADQQDEKCPDQGLPHVRPHPAVPVFCGHFDILRSRVPVRSRISLAQESQTRFV
jgi:hypothetical protein